MTIDKQKLKALAEAFPSDLDWDSNTEPFFNGPSGESLGGGSTGFYSVYGQPFTIDGEEYDGTEYVSICTREFAEFVCSARSAVLALLAEIERLEYQAESRRRLHAKECVAMSEVQGDLIDERDQLKAENQALRKALGEISVQVDGNIRCTVRDVVNGLPDVQDIYGYCDAIDEIIDAAMAKEVSQ